MERQDSLCAVLPLESPTIAALGPRRRTQARPVPPAGHEEGELPLPEARVESHRHGGQREVEPRSVHGEPRSRPLGSGRFGGYRGVWSVSQDLLVHGGLCWRWLDGGLTRTACSLRWCRLSDGASHEGLLVRYDCMGFRRGPHEICLILVLCYAFESPVSLGSLPDIPRCRVSRRLCYPRTKREAVTSDVDGGTVEDGQRLRAGLPSSCLLM